MFLMGVDEQADLGFSCLNMPQKLSVKERGPVI